MDQQQQQPQATPDIPDFNAQEVPKAVMSADVLGERNVRRYIRKDGLFNKDFVHFFDRNTGKFDSAGRTIYEPTMTVDQAQELITKLCTDTGRKVVVDSISKRPMSVPGWNLDIRVPGMADAEAKAATVPEGVLRERINNQVLIDQREMINDLTQKLAHLTAQLAPVPAPELTAAQKKAKAKAEAEAEAAKEK